MIVIDSCVWIHAFLQTDGKCVYILKKILDGEIKPVVSAYIAKEIVKISTCSKLRSGLYLESLM